MAGNDLGSLLGGLLGGGRGGSAGGGQMMSSREPAGTSPWGVSLSTACGSKQKL
ncbi:hypothetical protein [Streptomyces sp. NPDC048269]|uniref:hypothetical protein n=1 Tax=Streptomyces sp. NPDC048269 TaxID=3155753 RepID=UPI00341E25E3